MNSSVWTVETKGLSKTYQRVESLRDCSLRIAAGHVYGLLGPNGAGKTTLIRTLLGLIQPTRGSATVCGYDIRRQSLQVREQVSYLPGDARLYRGMRGKQVLELFAGLHRFGDLKLARQVADRLQLDLTRRVMFMSTGMRQKLAIAVVLGCRAPLVVLDEPTANLDPNVRSEVLQLVREIKQRGHTVLLSSHIFSDIDEACDQAAIMRSGRLVAEQSMAELQQLHIVRIDHASHSDWPGEQAWPQFVDFAERTRAETILQLAGPPPTWLSWLAAQPVRVVELHKAGIQAIYARHHFGDAHNVDVAT